MGSKGRPIHMFLAKDDQERRWGSKGRLGQNTSNLLIVMALTSLSRLSSGYRYSVRAGSRARGARW